MPGDTVTYATLDARDRAMLDAIEAEKEAERGRHHEQMRTFARRVAGIKARMRVRKHRKAKA